MRGYLPRTLLPIFCLLCLPAFSQGTAVVRIGVTMLRSGMKDAPGAEARNRLVKALNQHRTDRKLKVSLEAVGLDALPGSQAVAEAKEKNCEFVLYTRLQRLETSSKYEPMDGLAVGEQLPAATATVEYLLKRMTNGASFAMGSIKVEDAPSVQEAILQAMNRVGGKVLTDLRNGDGELLVEPKADQGMAEQPPFRPGDNFIATDFCAGLPTNIPHAAGLRGACEFAISLPQEMPNFICQQETSRYVGSNRVPNDLITALVRYEDGSDSYSEIKVNGKPAPSDISESPGLWSTGEFGDGLRAIFNSRNRGVFEFKGEGKRGDHMAWIFSYVISHQNDPSWRLHAEDQVVAPPYEGELWIDQKTGEVLRFRSVAKDIPLSFPLQVADRLTDFENVSFGDGTAFVLPVESTIVSRQRDEESMRNVVQFRGCHKFRARARMVLNVSGGAVGGGSSAGATSAELLEKELEENEKIYAILREQAVRDDAAELEAEQAQDLHWANAAVLWRLAALKKQRQENAAWQLARTTDEPPAPGKEDVPAFKVNVRLVPVSVVLRDANGRAVGDLSKQDFRLFDERKPQIISRFSIEHAAEEPALAEARTPAPGAVAAGEGKGPAIPERDVAYVFDDLHATFEDLANARDAAQRHLTELRGEDRVAVFTTSGQIELDFTADHNKLQGALRGLRPHSSTGPGDCPSVSYYMADLMLNRHDEGAADLATADALECAFHGGGKVEMAKAQQLAVAKAFEVLNAGRVESDRTLGILNNVIARTAAMPGRRSLVLVSPGFLTVAPEAQERAMHLLDLALQDDIVVNTLDMNGLSTTGMAANRSHPGDAQFDGQELLARSDVMADLAFGTGGVFFHNNNDLDEGFRRTAEAPEYMYVLGFSPKKLDGKFHTLKVTLRTEGKLEVQARRGYYASKPAPEKSE